MTQNLHKNEWFLCGFFSTFFSYVARHKMTQNHAEPNIFAVIFWYIIYKYTVGVRSELE